MANDALIALISMVMLAVEFLGWRSSLSERENAELFKTTGELKSPRYLVVLFLALGLLSSVISLATSHHGRGGATWPMALIGVAGSVFVWIRSFFGLRLEQNDIRFGWRCGQVVAYTDVLELERRSDSREAHLVLVLRSGVRRRIGRSLPCEWLLIDELQKRTGCTVTYWLGNRTIPKPEWLVLQSNCEKNKPGTRK